MSDCWKGKEEALRELYSPWLREEGWVVEDGYKLDGAEDTVGADGMSQNQDDKLVFRKIGENRITTE